MDITGAEQWLYDLYPVIDGEKCNEPRQLIFNKVIYLIYNLILYIVGYYKTVCHHSRRRFLCYRLRLRPLRPQCR